MEDYCQRYLILTKHVSIFKLKYINTTNNLSSKKQMK